MKKRILLITLIFIAAKLNSQNFINKDLVLKWNDGNTNWTTTDANSHILTSGQAGSAYPFQNRGNLVFQPRANNGADIVFGTGAIPLVRTVIKANGNVGIGTTNPNAKLDVNGSVKFNHSTSNHTNLQIGHDTNDRIFADNSSNKYYGGGMFFRITPDPSLNIAHNYIDVMMLTDKGKVGIGTRTMGDHRLAVEGSIGAREIKVEANGWSDFVFEKEYNLPSLKEVESHIKEKGHLKDIPSAEEVEQNGIFLGEMNAKLLQKIEELTLYTIQQQKEIETLKTMNSKLIELQKRLEKLEKK